MLNGKNADETFTQIWFGEVWICLLQCWWKWGWDRADESSIPPSLSQLPIDKRMSIINVTNTILILWLQVGPHCWWKFYSILVWRSVDLFVKDMLSKLWFSFSPAIVTDPSRIESHMYKCHVDACLVQFIFQFLKYIFHFLKMNLLDKLHLNVNRSFWFLWFLLYFYCYSSNIYLDFSFFFFSLLLDTQILKD